MEKILFHLGPIAIYKFGLTIALGILVGYWLVDREAGRRGFNRDQLLNLVILAVLGGIIGARIFYILAYAPGYYLQHPLDMLKIYEGGLSIHGGVMGALLAGWWYTRRARFDFWSSADLLVPGTILAQAIARIGCDIFGVPMTAIWPWGVNVDGNLVHPVQMYETILDLGLFLVLWGKRNRTYYSGQLLVCYLFGYFSIRFIVEFFRDNPLIIGPITPAHLTSVLFMAAALLIHVYRKRQACDSVIFSTAEPGISGRVWLGTVIIALIGGGIFYGWA